MWRCQIISARSSLSHCALCGNRAICWGTERQDCATIYSGRQSATPEGLPSAAHETCSTLQSLGSSAHPRNSSVWSHPHMGHRTCSCCDWAKRRLIDGGNAVLVFVSVTIERNVQRTSYRGGTRRSRRDAAHPPSTLHPKLRRLVQTARCM